MKKLPIIAALLAFLPFVACNKPEIVPAPTEKASLTTHFLGTINGTQIEWTKNVNGYTNTSSLENFYDSVAQAYNFVYYGGMASSSDPKQIRLGFGSFQADPKVQTSPSIATFKDFIMSFGDPATAPDFANGAIGGFEIQYVDAAGILFRTIDTSTVNDYTVTDIKFSEDEKGDYMSYTCAFNATLYYIVRNKANDADSVAKTAVISNAVMKGWLTRENN